MWGQEDTQKAQPAKLQDKVWGQGTVKDLRNQKGKTGVNRLGGSGRIVTPNSENVRADGSQNKNDRSTPISRRGGANGLVRANQKGSGRTQNLEGQTGTFLRNQGKEDGRKGRLPLEDDNTSRISGSPCRR